MIGQSASQGGGQSTLAAGTVFESTADTFLRIQSDIQFGKLLENLIRVTNHGGLKQYSSTGKCSCFTGKLVEFSMCFSDVSIFTRY